ncbi:charged multivesicular body protein 3-like [Artemia franciscana]|uniref:EOG090X0EF4 n=1 Tax=Artemia franciscana TaxID=6661 RepID=A0AA88HGH6_ARTSF|nr:hypothetical protein QYM36_016591 [Artemia franciscana]
MGLFGKTNIDPKEKVNEWCKKLRQEGFQIDRQIRAIQREEEKVKKSLKEAAKKGDKDVCKILAKEIVQSRRAVAKMYASKAQINSISLNMKNQLAIVRMTGSLQKSTEVMKMMSSLIKVPEISRTMQELSREMMKAGIVEEMIEDTMESVGDQEELEEEAQKEVDKVLWELTAGQLGKAPAVSTTTPSIATTEPTVTLEDEAELDEMQSRLAALRS